MTIQIVLLHVTSKNLKIFNKILKHRLLVEMLLEVLHVI